jgi:hypothetical protein
MDKLSEQVVCKIVGECTLADIGRVRDALLAVHGDSADNMKLWDVWKAGLKRVEILEKPVKVETTVPVPPPEKFQPTARQKGTARIKKISPSDYIVDAIVTMWLNGESFGFSDVCALLGERIPRWRWQDACNRARESGYIMTPSSRNRYAKWTIKKEGE